jgi:hypothetical protein
VGVGASTESVNEALQQFGHGLDRYRASFQIGA